MEDGKPIYADAAARLARFFDASTELMSILARACGHTHLNQFNIEDLTTFKSDIADLTGIEFGGIRGRQ